MLPRTFLGSLKKAQKPSQLHSVSRDEKYGFSQDEPVQSKDEDKYQPQSQYAAVD